MFRILTEKHLVRTPFALLPLEGEVPVSLWVAWHIWFCLLGLDWPNFYLSFLSTTLVFLCPHRVYSIHWSPLWRKLRRPTQMTCPCMSPFHNSVSAPAFLLLGVCAAVGISLSSFSILIHLPRTSGVRILGKFLLWDEERSPHCSNKKCTSKDIIKTTNCQKESKAMNQETKRRKRHKHKQHLIKTLKLIGDILKEKHTPISLHPIELDPYQIFRLYTQI